MRYRRMAAGLTGSLCMMFLILDGRTALDSARQGIQFCMQTVIPSLLPFFFLMGLAVGLFGGTELKFLRPISKFCSLPRGGTAYLIPGFLGGYPMGARAIGEGVSKGQLSRRDGGRMLLFCCNAGPAFLFGILGPMFPSPWMGWALWGIHIFSALLIGASLPGRSDGQAQSEQKPVHPAQAMGDAVRAMGLVCGWVICFRILSGFLESWFLQALPLCWRLLLSGALELTNGCRLLPLVESVPARFILASGLLGFGGICVAMQTSSVLKELPMRNYMIGKLLHGIISMLFAAAVMYGLWYLIPAVFCIPIYCKLKRNSRISPAHAV